MAEASCGAGTCRSEEDACFKHVRTVSAKQVNRRGGGAGNVVWPQRTVEDRRMASKPSVTPVLCG